MDDICINGHPPIKFNVMSTEPGATNFLLTECPLCKAFEDYTNEFDGECECGEPFFERIAKHPRVHRFDCQSCGVEIKVVCQRPIEKGKA